MTAELGVSLAERLAVIATVAFILSQVRVVRRILAGTGSPWDKVILTAVFGLMAIGGTYLGIPVNGAIANSGVIGPVIAGLLGGPLVGFAAGTIGGVHRYFLGGFAALACGLSTAAQGLLSGVVYQKVDEKHRFDWRVGLATGAAAESLQMLIILALSRPFQDAAALVGLIGAPMILVNSAFIAVLVTILRTVTHEEERLTAFRTDKALQIAGRTLPHLRRGLDQDSAFEVSRIIFEMINASAVAITDREKVLAHVGLGADHHRPGCPIKTETTRLVIDKGEIRVARRRREIGCPEPGCPLASGVVVPLKSRCRVVGTLKLYHSREEAITAPDLEFANGMAELFAIQLELADLAREAQLAAKAELKALRAQINPHFLYNALNTIRSFCRTDPSKARDLIAHLAEFFRRSLKSAGDYIMVKEELEQIEAYLTIERARFGDRLEVVLDVDPASLVEMIPPYILQPLVENAVKHGLLPSFGGGTVLIKARKTEAWLELAVSDTGVGMDASGRSRDLSGDAPESNGLGIGLQNLNDRLKSIFGQEYCLEVRSSPGRGTTVFLRIPCHNSTREG